MEDKAVGKRHLTPDHATVSVISEEIKVFGDNGRLIGEVDELVAIVASKSFTPASFIEKHMCQLSGSGFEAARQELEKVMGYVSNQVCQTANCQRFDHMSSHLEVSSVYVTHSRACSDLGECC